MDNIVNWWSEPKNDASVANICFSAVTRLNRYQSTRRDTNVRCMRLYGGTAFHTFNPYNYTRGTTAVLEDSRPRYNIVSSCVDTVHSRIAKSKPRIEFLTSGGDYASQKRSEKLSKFVLGLFENTDFYEHAQNCFRDGCVFDIGALKIFRDEGEIKIERVFPNEIYFDDADGYYNKPSHVYQVKYILKSVLKELFPKSADQYAVDTSQSSLDEEGQWASNTDTEYAVVIEAWHLKSGKKAKDGRHVIVVNGAGGGHVLLDEKYERDYFPFVFSKWSEPIVGPYGQSLAHRLMGKQIEINKMLQIIQKSFHLGAAFKVFLEYGSRVSEDHINNDIGSIVYYAGQKPDYTVPQTVHQEFFMHLKWLIQSSYEESGISQMSAASKKPSGLDAAVAIREAQDIESERFAVVAQRYERMFVQAAKQLIDLAKEIDEDEGKFEVKAESKRFVETISWKDVEIEDNEMVMQLFPVSMLPHTPEGRLNMVMDLINAGFIDRETGLGLLNFPDIEKELDLRLAPINDIKNTAMLIIDKGEYNPPEPFQNLQWGVKYFQSAYLNARENGVDEDRLEMLRQWMVAADSMMNPPQPEAGPLPIVPENVQVANAGAAPGMIDVGAQPPMEQPMQEPMPQ